MGIESDTDLDGELDNTAIPTSTDPPPPWISADVAKLAAEGGLGLQCFDARLVLVWLDEGERHRIGAGAAQLVGQHASALYPNEEDVAALAAALTSPPAAGPTAREVEVEGVRLRLLLSAMTSDGQPVLRVMTRVIRDEAAILLREMLDAIDVHLVRYDRNWRFTFVNAAAAHRLGASPTDLVGKSLFEAFPEAATSEYAMALRSARERNLRSRFEHLDTSTGRWIKSDIFPHRDGVVVLSSDVTEHRHAVDALVDADRRKDEFLATLAHELRNPLAPIRNATAYLRRVGAPEPDLLRAWNIIDRQVAGMARLVDDLLDVSRFTFGRFELHRGPTPLARALASAVDGAMPQIEAAHHTLSVALPPEELLVDGDPARITQIFLHLLNNAARYTPDRGQVSIESEWSDAWVSVRVRDNGVGIEPDMQRRIFDLFTQVDRRYDTPRGGLGVGLTLARQLTELHDGELAVHSAGRGMGTVFTVRLPRAVVPPPPAGSERSARPVRSLRVLLVDDNRDQTESLAAYLELFGHHTHVVRTGAEVHPVVDTFQPDVIVLDLGLPDVDGRDLARALRQAGVRATLIALTGWGAEETRAASLAAGFDHHLTKPIDPDLIASLIGGG